MIQEAFQDHNWIDARHEKQKYCGIVHQSTSVGGMMHIESKYMQHVKRELCNV